MKKIFLLLILVFLWVQVVMPLAFAADWVQVSVYTYDTGDPTKPFDINNPYQYPASGITFPGKLDGSPPYSKILSNPWVHSPQFMRIKYSSTQNTWGIRLYTDNNTDIGGIKPKILKADPGPDGKLGTTDDIILSTSYGGLINPATKGNPYMRAMQAWQVFKDPVYQPDPIDKDFFGEWNVGGNWTDDWAYVIDKSDYADGKQAIGGVYYPPPAPSYSAKYEMIAFGEKVVMFLAQHPVVSGSQTNPDPKKGDDDIVVYFSACFAAPSEEVKGNFDGIIPLGTYSTKIYIELINV